MDDEYMGDGDNSNYNDGDEFDMDREDEGMNDGDVDGFAEEYKFIEGNDFDDELDNDKSDDYNIEEEENSNIAFDPDLTDEIKKKLMYSDAALSDDHIFWINPKHNEVKRTREHLLNLQLNVKNANAEEKKQNIEKLEEAEQLFIRQFIKKIKFDKDAPDYARGLESKGKNFKLLSCPEQVKARRELEVFKRDLYLLKKYKNKYFKNLKNEYFRKQAEYKHKFWVPRTSTDIEVSEKPKQEMELKRITKPAWINDLSEHVKDQILYTNKHTSADQIFWINSRLKMVREAKNELRNMKNRFDKLSKEGDADDVAIEKAHKELQAKEDEFINLYLNKIEIDGNLPIIKPMSKCIQRALYKRLYYVFDVKNSVEQEEMYLKLKTLKSDQSYLTRVGNIHADSLSNQIYHKEWEFYKRFLSLKRTAVLEEPLGQNDFTDEQLQTMQLNNAQIENPPKRHRGRKIKEIIARGSGGGNAMGDSKGKPNKKKMSMNQNNRNMQSTNSNSRAETRQVQTHHKNQEHQNQQSLDRKPSDLTGTNFTPKSEFPNAFGYNDSNTQNKYGGNTHLDQPWNTQKIKEEYPSTVPREPQPWKSSEQNPRFNQDPNFGQDNRPNLSEWSGDNSRFSAGASNQRERKWKTEPAWEQGSQNIDLRGRSCNDRDTGATNAIGQFEQSSFSDRNYQDSYNQYGRREPSSWKNQDSKQERSSRIRPYEIPDARIPRNIYDEDRGFDQAYRIRSPSRKFDNTHREQSYQREQRSDRNQSRNNHGPYGQDVGGKWSNRNQHNSHPRHGQNYQGQSGYSQDSRNDTSHRYSDKSRGYRNDYQRDYQGY